MSAGSPRSAKAGGVGRLLRLTAKELNETLRDHRTVLTLVLMPLLLYPLLALGLRMLFAARLAPGEAPAYRVGYRSDTEHKPFRDRLDEGLRYLIRSGALREPDRQSPLATLAPTLHDYMVPDIDHAVISGAVDIGMRPRAGGDPELDWEVVYVPDSTVGQEAARYINRLCEGSNALARERKLGELVKAVAPYFRQLPQPLRTELTRLDRPFALHVGVAPLTPTGGRKPPPLLVLIPLVLILMTITGAVYPAIDLTAGERERGTLEVLMAAPVPRMSLLLAKYVAVLTVAMLTGLVNLVAMMLSVNISGLGPHLLGEQGLSALVLVEIVALVEIFFLLLLFTSFFAALLLALASLARSFKEAQAYLVPLMVVALIPGMVSLLPGIRLEGAVAFIPLLNIVLLARDVLWGTADVGDAIVVVGMTLIYALAAIALAAALFGRDAHMAGPAGRTPPKRHDFTPGPPSMVQ
jgi:ABC-2 type transport system permease protein/sodium transport system permease protein